MANHRVCMGFEVFTVVKIQVEVFWVVTVSSVTVGYHCFGAPCCLHLHFILKMLAARCSETLVMYRTTTQCHNPEDLDLNNGGFVFRSHMTVESWLLLYAQCWHHCTWAPSLGTHNISVSKNEQSFEVSHQSLLTPIVMIIQILSDKCIVISLLTPHLQWSSR
jgi:hypothetical protein